jgi:N-acetylglucosaminyl-diphospho-decaprenol L-rhamnosyltransferase
MSDFRHLILTRFNMRIEQCEPRGLDWLDHRFAIFERFCLPSVRSQTNQNFEWLVFFHPDMPEACKERVRAYSEWRAFRPVYFRSVFDLAMVQSVASDLANGYSHLITTRLDNDDAICRTFVDAIQQRFAEQDFQFLNFTNGYIWKEGHLYPAQHFSNAFVSLVERAEKCSTVYCRNHMELDHVGPILQIQDAAAWLQVVHGRNLSNDAWGTAEEPCDLHENFGIALGDLTSALPAAPSGKAAPAASGEAMNSPVSSRRA